METENRIQKHSWSRDSALPLAKDWLSQQRSSREGREAGKQMCG